MTAWGELPARLTDAALTDRLALALPESLGSIGFRSPSTGVPVTAFGGMLAAELVPEVKRIAVDVLLEVIEALRDSDGCQDWPFTLAEQIDAEHLHYRLSAQYRAAEMREMTDGGG